MEAGRGIESTLDKPPPRVRRATVRGARGLDRRILEDVSCGLQTCVTDRRK